MALETIGMRVVLEGASKYLSDMSAAEKAQKGLGDSAVAAANKTKEYQATLTKLSVAGTSALGGLGAVALKNAIDFESSFAGVRKTVDATEEEYKQLATAFRDMAKEIPINVNEINRIGEAAGQLGIKKENIVGFARVMADLGVATNLASDQAATALARMANITGMAQTDFDRLGSTIVALGNNFATTESEIVEMGLRIAGAGAQIGLSEANIMGFATALSSVGIEAQAGGTAISKVMIDIAQNVRMAGDSLPIFADLAGMSVDEFSRLFEEDAATAIIAFINGLGEMSAAGGNVFQILEDLGFTEVRLRDALLRASGAGDLLTRSLELSTKAWEDNTALTKEAEQRYKTTASQMILFKNNLQDIGIELGSRALPVLNQLLGVGSGLAEQFGRLPSSTQNLTLAFVGLAVSLPAAIAGIERMVGLFGNLGGSLQTLPGRLTAVTVGIGALILAADVIAQKTSGHGLMDLVFGDVDKIEASAEATKRMNALLAGTATETDRIAIAERELEEATRAVTGELNPFNDTLSTTEKLVFGTDGKFFGVSTTLFGFGKNVVDRNKDIAALNAQVAEAARVLQANGASVLQLAEYYRALPDDLKPAFDSVTGIESAMRSQTFAMESAKTVTDGWMGSMQLAKVEVQETKEEIVKAKTPLDEFNDSLDEGADYAKEFEQALDAIDERLATMNPEVFVLQGQLAAVDEELADLKRSGDDWSESMGMSRAELEELKKKLEDQVESYRENEDAIKKVRNELQLYMGNEIINLKTALADSKLSWEEQTDAELKVAEALRALSNDDIPGFLSALGEIETKAPGIAAVVVDNLGPELATKLRANIPELRKASGEMGDAVADQVEKSMVTGASAISAAGRGMIRAAIDEMKPIGSSGGYEVGAAMSAGAAAGLAAVEAATAVSVSAKSIVQTALFSMRREAQIGSPSRVAAMLVGLPLAQGVAMGLEEGMPQLAEVAANTARQAMNAMLFGLKTGEQMLPQELNSLLQLMKNTITAAGLPEEMRKNAENTVKNFAAGIEAGEGLANSAVAAFFSTIIAAINSGNAAINAIPAATIKAPVVGPSGDVVPGFGATPSSYILGSDGKWYPNESAMPPGVTGASSIPQSTVHTGALTNFRNASWATAAIPPELQNAFNNPATATDAEIAALQRWQAQNTRTGTDVSGILSGLQQGWWSGYDLSEAEKALIRAQYAHLGIAPPFPGFAIGIDYVPRTMLAMLHQGERVVPAIENRVSRPVGAAGASQGATVAIDLRGATFTGTPEENASAIEAQVSEAMARMYGRDAFVAGRRPIYA